MIDFGKALRHAQIQAEVNNATLAKRMSVYPQQVSVWRNKKDASLKLCDQLCQAMDLDIKQFVEWAKHE